MEISVVIPAYNAADTIAACLEGLLRQTVPRDRYEIVVVDDGSCDGTREMVARYPVRLIAQAHLGPGAARNRGVVEASGEVVLFTDADCVPAKNWVAEMVEPLESVDVVGVKGAYGTRQRGVIPRFVQREYEERYRRMAKQSQIDFVDTYAAAYRRNVLLREGGFDDLHYPDACEDQELSFRLAERGYKMVFNREAVVYHQHPQSLAAYLRRKFNIGYWKVMVLRRHPRKAFRDSHTPQSLKVQMALVAVLISLLVLIFVGGVVPWLFLLALTLFLASVAPLAIRTVLQDPPVGVLAPLLLFLRALALGAGMIQGGLHYFLFGRRRSA